MRTNTWWLSTRPRGWPSIPGRATTGTPWATGWPGTTHPGESATCSGRSTGWTGTPAAWFAWPSTPMPPNSWAGQWNRASFKKPIWPSVRGCRRSSRGWWTPPSGGGEGSVLARQVRPDGKRAVTRYRALGGRRGRTLLQLWPETGRTHQIRVHMAWLGHPLTGDFLYGREAPEVIGRTALHACALSFPHPITGQRLLFRAPLPADMARLLQA